MLNEKQIKQVYTNEINSAMPDFEKLWAELEPKIPAKEPLPKIRRISKHTAYSMVAAASILLFIVVPVWFANEISNLSLNYPTNYDQPPQGGDAIMPDEPQTESVQPVVNNAIYYESLNFAEVTKTAVKSSGILSEFADDYFVEDEVLAKTDVLDYFVVRNVFEDDNGDVYYDVNDANSTVIVAYTVKSNTPFMLQIGRKYLLPLVDTQNGYYELAFENAPQIEVTLDGGMVFHNGWTLLNPDADVIYPKTNTDDFFYDRMKFSYNPNTQALFDKWHELKQ